MPEAWRDRADLAALLPGILDHAIARFPGHPHPNISNPVFATVLSLFVPKKEQNSIRQDNNHTLCCAILLPLRLSFGARES